MCIGWNMKYHLRTSNSHNLTAFQKSRHLKKNINRKQLSSWLKFEIMIAYAGRMKYETSLKTFNPRTLKASKKTKHPENNCNQKDSARDFFWNMKHLWYCQPTYIDSILRNLSIQQKTATKSNSIHGLNLENMIAHVLCLKHETSPRLPTHLLWQYLRKPQHSTKKLKPKATQLMVLNWTT